MSLSHLLAVLRARWIVVLLTLLLSVGTEVIVLLVNGFGRLRAIS